VQVTIVAGALGSAVPPSPPPHSYASKAGSDVAIWVIRVERAAAWTLPPVPRGVNRFLYCFSRHDVAIAGQRVAGQQLVVVDAAEAVTLAAGDEAVEILMLQGRPIPEPVAQYGPFVMNTRAEVQQAFEDYRRTQFGGWPWPSPDPVNGDEGRFARTPDGRVERPR
jgi:redox-sensitive bicupin YhaK (pirin superfamily)